MNHNQRYYLLDALRGLSAVAILVWHFQTFYFEVGGEVPVGFDSSLQPFFEYLHPLYNRGYLAVQLFWVLSGFVFFSVYLSSLNARSVSPGEFFILRFSRLYPLHFLTLIMVGLLQIVSERLLGDSILYHHNDIKHLVLNFALISHWGFQDGWSFNAPIWSVSLEIFAYFVFFVFAFAGFRTLVSTFFVALVAIAALHFGSGNYWFREFGMTTACFFLGGGVQLLCEKIKSRGKALTIAGFLIACALFLVVFFSMDSLTDTLGQKQLLSLVVFPIVVFALGLIQFVRSSLGSSFKMLGDISYGLYLIHTPIIICILLFANYAGLRLKLDSVFFIQYIALSVFAAYLVYHLFERPMQRLIRKKAGV